MSIDKKFIHALLKNEPAENAVKIEFYIDRAQTRLLGGFLRPYFLKTTNYSTAPPRRRGMPREIRDRNLCANCVPCLDETNSNLL